MLFFSYLFPKVCSKMPHTSINLRQSIIEEYLKKSQTNISLAQIAKDYKVSKSTIYRIVKSYKETRNILPQKRTPRNLATTATEDQMILDTLQQEDIYTAKDIKRSIGSSIPEVSIRTIQRRLVASGEKYKQ